MPNDGWLGRVTKERLVEDVEGDGKGDDGGETKNDYLPNREGAQEGFKGMGNGCEKTHSERKVVAKVYTDLQEECSNKEGMARRDFGELEVWNRVNPKKLLQSGTRIV